MQDMTARLSLPLILPSQAQKHVTHNEALALLDVVTQLVIDGFDVDTPPDPPAEGPVWAIGAAPTGDWNGHAGELATWSGGGWRFIVPEPGWTALAAGTYEQRVWTGSAWQAMALDNLDRVGVNASADATNRLSVSSAATLLNHEGAGHQLKVNKAAAADTASLLFQSDFTGHAEMGLAGDTDFSVKVSPDGSAWTEALVIDATSGKMTGEAIQASATDTTAGRLMRADYGYGPGNVLGAASQSGGIPTGAVIERGSNANGDYVRFADGTQICTHFKTIAYAAGSYLSSLWAFPAAFASGSIPNVMMTPQATAVPTAAGRERGDMNPYQANTAHTFVLIQMWRRSGATDFVSGDTSDLYVTAIGRWF